MREPEIDWDLEVKVRFTRGHTLQLLTLLLYLRGLLFLLYYSTYTTLSLGARHRPTR